MKDSDTGNAGSLPYQLGILHILSFYFSYLSLLSLASVKDSDTGNAGSLPYQLGILHILSFYFSDLCLLSLASVKDSDTGNAGSLPYQLGILHILSFYFSDLCLLSLASVKDSDTGNAGLPYQLGILQILSFYFSYLCLLSLASVKDSEPGNAGLPYQLGILHILPFYFSYQFLTLSLSGKGPCIRHTKVQWEVGTRYINPLQPYSFSRQLYLSYQDRLCTVIQLGIVRVVIWFPCWGPVGLRAGILMPRFCSSIPQHLGPLIWAPRSLVTIVLLRQGQQTQLGGRHFSSWQPVAVLPMQAGLPLCQCHLDPLQLSHLCLSLWEV